MSAVSALEQPLLGFAFLTNQMNSFTVLFVGVDGVDIEDFTESGDFDD